MRASLSSAAAITCLLLAVATGSVAQESADQESIALEWIAAHNSGETDTMREFRSRHFRLSQAGDWESTFRSFVDATGRLEVRGILIDQENQVAVDVVSERRGEMRLQFTFDGDAPGQIREVALDRAGDRSRSDLPPLELAGDSWSVWRSGIDGYLRGLAEQDRFSGTVMIVERGEVRFEGAYGLACREFGAANTLNTRFDVGSFNKDYTRLAILQLQEKGKLQLSDAVGKHLPDYPNARVRRKVTIQQLLDHRSGLGDYFTDEYFATPMGKLREIDDYLPIWGPKPLLYEPGEREEYSNYGYTVLGAIIEKLTGTSYPDYVEEHIFAPAGMDRSGFFETDRPEPDVAVGYTRMGPGGERGEGLYKNIYLEPARGGPWGKSYSTVGDLYRFFQAMFDGGLLSEENNWLRRGWDSSIALAGGGPGLNAMLLLENGRMILVMANLDPPIADHVAESLQNALER